MIEFELFISNLKPTLYKRIKSVEKENIKAILEACEKQEVTELNHIAYILATAYHEGYDYRNNIRITPITELGKPSYLKSKPYYPYIGRGFVQITWIDNYIKFSKILGIDLVGDVDKALDKEIAAFILVYGMKHGTFTGKKLSDYINKDGKVDFISARKIINGSDKAKTIEFYAIHFLKALTNAKINPV